MLNTSHTEKRPPRLMLLVCSLLLLSGCEGNKLRASATTQPTKLQEMEKTRAQSEAERLAQCQKELDALKGITPAQHTTFRLEFDRLMNGAALYASLRIRVNNDTQETVDALYRYKIKRLCADIGQAVLTGLAERGERLK